MKCQYSIKEKPLNVKLMINMRLMLFGVVQKPLQRVPIEEIGVDDSKETEVFRQRRLETTQTLPSEVQRDLEQFDAKFACSDSATTSHRVDTNTTSEPSHRVDTDTTSESSHRVDTNTTSESSPSGSTSVNILHCDAYKTHQKMFLS